MSHSEKPTGGKNYGSIGHLPNSRLGAGDHKVPDGMATICCEKVRDKHDRIIVQEKLDGSNVGVALVNGVIHPIARAGYRAETSPYEQHHKFASWAMKNESRFRAVLNEGERIVGEWLALAHGTKYTLQHEPFVAFDIMTGKKRIPYAEFSSRNTEFVMPYLISNGPSVSVEDALMDLGDYGKHGATEKVEGAMWRVERNNLIDKKKGGERKWEVDFLAKYVRPDKVDGCYLGDELIWNQGLEL